MPSFRNAKSQAKHAINKKLNIGAPKHAQHDKKIHSLGTVRNYAQALTRITQWIKENRLGDLNQLTENKAIQYLERRGQVVSQKMLDQERQALQFHLNKKLPVIKSELTQILKSRAYTDAQVKMISNAQTSKNQLATKIAYAAGLRAHELLTLQPQKDRVASKHRQWSANRFQGRAGVIYTVIGKGGLIREVLIPKELSSQLEALKFSKPLKIKDRNIYYHQNYNIGGGKNWSNSFSSASKRLLNWSHGAHGLRHTYAQQRMSELQQRHYFYEEALKIVSQELGHFRPEITEVYLR